MRTSILVVAEQTALRAAVGRILLPIGYRVEIASSEKMARRLIRKERFDAAVAVSAALTDSELAFLRDLQSEVGKLVLLAEDASARSRFAASIPEALVCPARPLQAEKLIACLGTAPDTVAEAVNATDLLHFVGCTLEPTSRIFCTPGRQEVALTRREFALLVAFLRNPGRVLSRAQLRDAIDGGSAEPFDRSIDMLVARLRRKIEPNPAAPRVIVTVPGTGYKFVPPARADAAIARETPRGDRVAPSRQPVERRQLTVLCCQILGFAALAARSEPEDLEQMIGPVYAACAEIIGRFGGTMARPLGDGVIAYFGHPRAGENDAENAVRAGVELLRVIGGIEAAPHFSFRARIGAATGLMVIGEPDSGGNAPTAIGEALNLALHLQQAAPAAGLLIAANTRDLIGRLFDCRQFGPVALEEDQEAAPAWRVIDAIASMPRFEALRGDAMLELVGREAEIERLSRCWSKARHGSGQVVVVTGEAGIGKSRLVIAFEEQPSLEPHAAIHYFGAPHRAKAPMSILLDELQRSAGFGHGDSAPQKLEKIRNLFAARDGGEEAAALVARLLDLPGETRPDLGELSPQKRKARAFAALLARIESIASLQPVLAVVEDIQWSDPTSLEFLAQLVERAAALPLLLIVVGRPEFAPPWPDHAHVSTLTLSRLSRSGSARLIHQVAGDRPIPRQLEEQILDRADGVPLFIEELTKAVLEREAGGDDRRPLHSRRPDAARSIPTTLHGLLLARLDRLERGKEIAQAGAVIGREFSFELLSMVTRLDEATLAAALDQLVGSGLVFRRGAPPLATFVFKHALVRDAAYDMLLRRRRQQLHAALAQCYEDHFPETVEAQPELLAYHFREAGNPPKSVGYLLLAAERAVAHSSALEAMTHLAQARDLLAALPKDRERLQLELTLELTHGRAFIAQHGYPAPETREAYRRARALCETLGEETSLPLIVHAQWLSAWSAADHGHAGKEAQELYSWGERNNEPAAIATAHVNFGMHFAVLGDLARARRHLEQSLQINQFALPGHRRSMFSDTEPGRLSALSYLHYCLFLLGVPDQARAMARAATAQSPRQSYTQVLAGIYFLRMHVLERDIERAAAAGAAALRLAQELGYPYFIGTIMIHAGWAMARCGDVEGGIAHCRGGLAQLQAIGVKCWSPLYLALLGECYEQARDIARGVEAVAAALERVAATGERLWEAEIYRLKGRMLLGAGGDPDAAQACFSAALDTARCQGAKLLELRAAMSLARLWCGQGRHERARNLLAPVYNWFTEGFDTLDLQEAKALLDQLA